MTTSEHSGSVPSDTQLLARRSRRKVCPPAPHPGHGGELHRRLDRQDHHRCGRCSDWFEAGLVAYSYEAKQALLGVRAETLLREGAVSEETALKWSTAR